MSVLFSSRPFLVRHKVLDMDRNHELSVERNSRRNGLNTETQTMPRPTGNGEKLSESTVEKTSQKEMWSSEFAADGEMGAKPMELSLEKELNGSPSSSQLDLEIKSDGNPESLELNIDIEDQNDRDEGQKARGALGTVLSRISTRASCKDPGPPPDGGWVAWTQGSWPTVA